MLEVLSERGRGPCLQVNDAGAAIDQRDTRWVKILRDILKDREGNVFEENIEMPMPQLASFSY